MAEGARFPWKTQKIRSRGPTADYRNLKEKLPMPPSNMTWQQNKKTREWKLVAADDDDDIVKATLTEEQALVDQLPSADLDANDWELLSDKKGSGHENSSSTSSSSAIFVKSNGSVRTHASVGSISVPFKIQRTPSNSTIDSQDHTLGPSGKGVLGVDYVEHVVLPTDTIQGICLAYKVNATKLRQANHFSGNSLYLAPQKLVIPISKKALRAGFIRVQDTDAKTFKLHSFIAEFPRLSLTEAKAYLELANWVLADAMASAREDQEWEREMQSGPVDADQLKSGEIRITRKGSGDCARLSTRGAGIPRIPSEQDDDEDDDDLAVQQQQQQQRNAGGVDHVPPPPSPQAVSPDSDNVMKVKDVYDASLQQDGHFGVELQSFAAVAKAPLVAEGP